MYVLRDDTKVDGKTIPRGTELPEVCRWHGGYVIATAIVPGGRMNLILRPDDISEK